MPGNLYAVIEFNSPRRFAARREFSGEPLSGIGWISRGAPSTYSRIARRVSRLNRLVNQ